MGLNPPFGVEKLLARRSLYIESKPLTPANEAPQSKEPTMAHSKSQILAWVNAHDTGIRPTGLMLNNGSILIRSLGIDPLGNSMVETTVIDTLAEAREALGY